MSEQSIFYYVTYKYETPTSMALCAVTTNTGRRLETPADIDWLYTHIANLEAKDGTELEIGDIYITNFIRLGV